MRRLRTGIDDLPTGRQEIGTVGNEVELIEDSILDVEALARACMS